MKARTSFALFAAFLCLLPLSSLCPAADADGPGSVDEAWMKAMKANDLDAIVACYAKDAIAWLPNEAQAKGTDAIRATYKGLLDTYTVSDVKNADTAYQTFGDRAVAWGTFTLVLTPKNGGAAMTMTGRYTEFLEKRDGRWVYVVDHASADPAPAKPMEK